ncbi:hypothetical protein Tco_0959478 [Tanacetum coccineum]
MMVSTGGVELATRDMVVMRSGGGKDGGAWRDGGGDGDVRVESDGGGDDDDGVWLRWLMVEVVLWWDGDSGDEGDGGIVMWQRLAGIWPEVGKFLTTLLVY